MPEPDDLDRLETEWLDHAEWLDGQLQGLRRLLSPVWATKRMLRNAIKHTHHCIPDAEAGEVWVKENDGTFHVCQVTQLEWHWEHDDTVLVGFDRSKAAERQDLFAKLDALAVRWGPQLKDFSDMSLEMKSVQSMLKSIAKQKAKAAANPAKRRK